MKKDFLYVLIQFAFFALYFIDWDVFSFSLPLWTNYIFLSLCALGVCIILLGILNLNENLTPFPSPKRHSILISHGIYRYLRHPIYTGILMTLGSYALYSGSLFRLGITGILVVVFYFKSDYEEKLLVERYEQYEDYKKTAGRFFPKF